MAVRELLEHTWERVLTKEINALRKALKKPESFSDRVKDFYTKFIEHLQVVFEPIVRAYLETDEEKSLMKKIAGEYVARHQQVINVLLDEANEDEMEARVNLVLLSWETQEPLLMADILSRETDNAL